MVRALVRARTAASSGVINGASWHCAHQARARPCRRLITHISCASTVIAVLLLILTSILPSCGGLSSARVVAPTDRARRLVEDAVRTSPTRVGEDASDAQVAVVNDVDAAG